MWSFNVSKLEMIFYHLESLVLSLACSPMERCIPHGWNLQPSLSVQDGKKWIPYQMGFWPPLCQRTRGWFDTLSICAHAQFDLNPASKCILKDEIGSSCT